MDRLDGRCRERGWLVGVVVIEFERQVQHPDRWDWFFGSMY